jgi:hypothetical protein
VLALVSHSRNGADRAEQLHQYFSTSIRDLAITFTTEIKVWIQGQDWYLPLRYNSGTKNYKSIFLPTNISILGIGIIVNVLFRLIVRRIA